MLHLIRLGKEPLLKNNLAVYSTRASSRICYMTSSDRLKTHLNHIAPHMNVADMAAKMDINTKLKMNSGYEIPQLGFGVYQTPADVTEDVVNHALKSGYRHVDSAIMYRNEAPSAKALNASSIDRSTLFFTSKIPPPSMGYDAAKAAIAKTMTEIGSLGYVDLMILHSPYGGKDGRLGAWKALVEAVEEGKIRSIGVSNFGVHHLEELEAHIKEIEAKEGNGKGGVISINQIELHPFLPHKDIVEWCHKRGVLVEAYSPLVQSQRADDPLLKPICKRTGKSFAQVLIRWSLQKGYIPLPKSVTHSRIEQNADIYDFELTAEEMKSLETDEYSGVCWDPTVAPLDK